MLSVKVLVKKLIRTAARWLRRLTGTTRDTSSMPADLRQAVSRVEAVMALQKSGEMLDDDYWAQKLRQAAHIIDKGLRRPDAEPGHSARWYQSAQEALSHLRGSPILVDPSLTWALKKLSDYEAVQSGQARSAEPLPEREAVLSQESLHGLITSRRSVRFFEEREISADVVEKVIDVINWSPTSCNRQPAKVYVANDPELARSCLDTCQGATGFGAFVPCFLCFCADLRSYWLPKEMLLPVIDVSLGIQNCCLMAHAMGLGITLLSWAQHTEDEDARLRGMLGIPEHYEIVLNAALGYPAQRPEVPLRKSVELTRVVRSSQGPPGRGRRHRGNVLADTALGLKQGDHLSSSRR
jgi:nitroreductase